MYHCMHHAEIFIHVGLHYWWAWRRDIGEGGKAEFSCYVTCGASTGLVAVCWASLLYLGFQGYTNATKAIIATARKITQR